MGNQELFFFPDRILIYQGSEVDAAQYKDLALALERVSFVESGGVPSDRRFSNNAQIPIVQYGDLTFRSASGMNFFLQCSSPAKAAEFKAGVEAYAAVR